ncbi:hypothetical protein AC1031_002205 [Aphanomyces cochlioides]|nr:hypothetical protein AC1031_002205 [Aphanomyces cochlioides]
MSLWERTAKEELAAKEKSLDENEYLREAIYQNATFIEQMQRVFHKKPRLTVRFFLHGIPNYCPLVVPYRYPLGGVEILQAGSSRGFSSLFKFGERLDDGVSGASRIVQT